MSMGGLVALTLCAALCAAPAAFAQAQPEATPKYAQSLPDVSPEADALAKAGAREVSTGDPDEDATLAVIADFSQRGMAALGEHEEALRKVLADMPRPFVREHVEGDHVVYRGDSMADCIAFGATLNARPDGRRPLVCKGNPYAVAAFYLGSYLNEMHRYDEALAILDLGVEAAPNAPMLITERDAALIGRGRWADLLAGAKLGLAIPDLSPKDHARLLRNLGYALTELQRLDEAQQAYEDSLKLEPGNAVAFNELSYIARLRSGGQPAPSVVFLPNAPRKPATP